MLPATLQTTNPFILALQSKKILDYDKKSDALKEFSDLISKTYFEAGQKSEADNLKLLCIGLHDEVKKYFPFLRIEELRIAFANGVRKEYGEFFGLNIATFHFWIKSWQFDEKRKSALQSIKQASERVYEPVLDKTQAAYEWKRTIEAQFVKFKETGVFICEFPSFQFTEFENRGLIQISNEEKKKLLAEAKKYVIEKKKRQRLNPKSKIELTQLSESIKRIEENQMTSHEQQEIKTEARREAIKQFYQSITELKL
jgi:hypothetical protein